MVPLDDYPHRRYNPLLAEWVLVSPHRTKRPWQGQTEAPDQATRPTYDPACYLCPGNTRANGEQNPQYESTFVFTNDFSAVLEDTPEFSEEGNGLFRLESARGECRVICFSPRHDLTFAEMEVADIRTVIKTWIEQSVDLGKKYEWVQIFENKGAVMGCSNPHPHGQIWAGNYVPSLVDREDRNQREYFNNKGTPMLMDYIEAELEAQTRVVDENEDWATIVPFWAVWPYEVIVLPKRPVAQITDLLPRENHSLAEILKLTLTRYDNLFQCSFPYSMGWHGAPFNDQPKEHWVFHGHYYPPLLRSSSIKKFMVGYEMLGEPQRDITAEQAAQKLRDCSIIHFRDQK